MRNIFAVCVLLSLMTFKVYSQDAYFVNDTWENVVKLAEKKNQMIMVYVYSDDKKCSACESITHLFSDTTLLSQYSKEMILFKANISQKFSKNLISKYYVNQIPSILLVLPNGNLFRKLTIQEALPKEIIKNFIDGNKKEFDVYYNYSQDFKNPESIKKYLIQRSGYGKQWQNQEILESYLQKISIKEQESEETLDLILKAGFSLNGKAIEILYKHLQTAATQENLIKLYLIKEKLFDSIIETINRGTLESKVNLKKALQITERINSISPKFEFYDKQMLELVYYANAKNKVKFMKIAKLYFTKNAPHLNKNVLISIDILNKVQVKKITSIDSILKNNNKYAINKISNFQVNNETKKLTIIAKVIYFQQLQPRNIELGIKYAEKALELAPNASKYAILGLLYNKNEQYKIAYEMLFNAMELQTNKYDKIDADIYKDAFSTLLEIKKRIPENY